MPPTVATEGPTMTPRIWSHPVHHGPLPHVRLPWWPRAPRLHLSHRQVVALRKGLIVALCALLAGSLTWHLRGSTRGPLSPTSAAATTRA